MKNPEYKLVDKLKLIIHSILKMVVDGYEGDLSFGDCTDL